jgi:hypothetical protein
MSDNLSWIWQPFICELSYKPIWLIWMQTHGLLVNIGFLLVIAGILAIGWFKPCFQIGAGVLCFFILLLGLGA